MMRVKTLDHINIRSAALAESIHFYGRVIGMPIVAPPGAPDLSRGAYCSDAHGTPIVHLIGTQMSAPGIEPIRGTARRGMIDHFALRCAGDPSELKLRLNESAIGFDETHDAQSGKWRIFVRDPNGVLVELDFSP